MKNKEVSFIMASINSHDRINDRLSPSKKKKGGKGFLIACVAFVAVIILIVIAINVFGKTEIQPNKVVTPDNVDDIIESMEKDKVSSGNYNVRMNPTWTFEEGNLTSKDAYVENPATNNNDVYFTIALADTEEVILTSPVIPLGSSLQDITLEKSLSVGTHDCIITYHLLDSDGDEESSVNLTLTIMVNN